MGRGFAIWWGLLWILGGLLQAAPLEVELEAEPREITTAGRVEVTLTATADEERGLLLPEIRERLGEFEVSSSSRSPLKLDPDTARLSQSLRLTLLPGLPGDYEIPPLAVRSGGEERFTAAIPVKVTSVLPPETDGLEPRPLEPALVERDLGWYLGWALGIGVVGGVLWCISRNVRGALDVGEAGGPEAHRRALAKLPAEADPETVHELALEFLRDEFGPRAETLTAGEVGDRPALTHYLTTYDNVRFSGSASGGAELRAALETLIREEGAD